MLEPPRLKVEEKMESICARVRAWMGLFLLTKRDDVVDEVDELRKDVHQHHDRHDGGNHADHERAEQDRKSVV